MRYLVMMGCCFINFNSVAATRTWDGGAGTNSWHQAANWNPDGVPMTGDDVVIDVPQATTVVHSTGISNLNSLWTNQTLSITNQSSVILQNASTFKNLILQGTLGGAGTVNIQGILTWNSGSMTGTGTTVIHRGAALNMLVSNIRNLSRTLQNDGTGTWSNGVWNFNNGVFMNNGDFTLGSDAAELQAMGVSSSSSQFVNNGSLTKVGIQDFDVAGLNPAILAFHNAGQVAIQAGDVNIYSGVQDGEFLVSEGALLTFTGLGPHTFNASASVTGEGSLLLAPQLSQTLQINSTIDVGDELELTAKGGTMTFTAPVACAKLTTQDVPVISFNSTVALDPAGQHSIAGGTVNFNLAGGHVDFAGTMNNATINGPSHIHITGQANIGSTQVGGSGDLIVEETGNLTLYTGATKAVLRDIINNGTLEISTQVRMQSADIINNGECFADVPNGSTALLQRVNSSTTTLVNHGLVRKLGEGDWVIGATNLPFLLSNFSDGSVIVERGWLTLTAGSSSGSFDVLQEGTLRFLGPYTHGLQSSVSGTGALMYSSGTHNINGNIAGFAGSLILNNGSSATVNLNIAAPNLGAVNVAQGLLNVNAAQQWGVVTVGPNGGRMGGSATVTITDSCVVHNGELLGAGQTIIAPGASAEFESSITLGRPLINHGTANGTQAFFACQNGKFINHGTFLSSAATSFSGVIGTNIFENHGLFTKDSGLTAQFVNSGAPMPLVNQGVIEVADGIVKIMSGGAGSGQVHIGPAGELQINSNYQDGELQLEGKLTITSQGKLTLAEGLVQSPSGTLSLQLSSTGNHIACGGPVQLSGSLLATAFNPTGAVRNAIIVESAESLAGQFTNASLNPNGLLQYEPTNVRWMLSTAGDVNVDGTVNVDDLVAIIVNWGLCSDSSCPSDVAPLGGNHLINIDDLLMVLNQWDE